MKPLELMEIPGKLLVEVTADALIVAMSAVNLWQFSCIWLYGRVCFIEPDIAILAFETCMFIAILVFGVKRLLRYCKKE